MCMKYNHHQPIPICEMDSSSLCDVAFAMASGSSRGKGNTSLTHTDKMQTNQCRNETEGCRGKWGVTNVTITC